MLECVILHNVIGVFGIVVTKCSYLSLFPIYIDNNNSTITFTIDKIPFLNKKLQIHCDRVLNSLFYVISNKMKNRYYGFIIWYLKIYIYLCIAITTLYNNYKV